MASFVNEFGKQARAIVSTIDAPSMVTWGLIPALIVLLLAYAFVWWMKPKFSGTQTVQQCTDNKVTGDQQCKDVQMSRKWNLLIAIGLPLLIASSVGFFSYRIGIMVKNPKLGMGIMTTSMISSAITGN